MSAERGEHDPLISGTTHGNSQGLESILLQGETVVYSSSVSNGKYYTKPLVIMGILFFLVVSSAVVITAVIFPALYIAVAIAPVSLAGMFMLYVISNSHTTNIITNMRVITTTRKFGNLTARFQFFSCIQSIKIESGNHIVFKTYTQISEEAGRRYVRFFMFTDLENVKHVHQIACRVHAEPHTNLPVSRTPLQSAHSIEKLTNQQRGLLDEYLAASVGDEVRYVYIPSTWQAMKKFALAMDLPCLVIVWIMYWVIVPAHPEISFSKFAVIAAPAVVMLAIPFLTMIAMKQTYVVTDRGVLDFFTGSPARTVDTSNDSMGRRRLFGSRSKGHVLVTYISPNGMGTITTVTKTKNGDGQGTIRFSAGMFRGMTNCPDACAIIQHFAGTLRSGPPIQHVVHAPITYVPTLYAPPQGVYAQPPSTGYPAAGYAPAGYPPAGYPPAGVYTPAPVMYAPQVAYAPGGYGAAQTYANQEHTRVNY